VAKHLTPRRHWGIGSCSQVDRDQQYLSVFEKQDPDILVEPTQSASKLQIAANQLNLELVATLLRESDEDIPYTWVNFRKQNFLHLMILHGDVELVSKLVKLCNLFQRDFRGCTPLDLAIYVDNPEIVALLVNTNSNVVNMADDAYSVTPLMFACINGNSEIADCLLANGALVNEQDRGGGTALMKACIYGHYDCVLSLINASALVGLEDLEGFSALLLSLIFGHDKIAKFLLDFGANFSNSTEDGESPFFVALMRKCIPAVKTMMVFDSVLEDLVGRHRQSIYHRIIMYCEEDDILEYFKLFKESTMPDFNSKNRMSQPPLFYAAHFNYTQVMKFLLENKCDPRHKDRHGNSVLHFCSSGEGVKVIIDSLNANWPPNVVLEELNHANNNGNTPIHAAYAFGDVEHIQILIQKGAELNRKNNNGNIPHHMLLCDRRRLLPLHLTDEEAPKTGGFLIGSLHVAVDRLINF